MGVAAVVTADSDAPGTASSCSEGGPGVPAIRSLASGRADTPWDDAGLVSDCGGGGGAGSIGEDVPDAGTACLWVSKALGASETDMSMPEGRKGTAVERPAQP